jgi:hypothetical protein
MAEAPEKLPALEPGFEFGWSTAFARPMASVLGEGRGPHTLPTPASDRVPPQAEIQRPTPEPIPLRRRPRGRRP